MSDIHSKSLNAPITPEQTARFYGDHGDAAAIGVEVERQLFAYDEPITVETNARLTEAAKSKGLDLSQEASAHMVEYKSSPVTFDAFHVLADQVLYADSVLVSVCDDLNIEISDKANDRSLDGVDLSGNTHPRERSQVFLDYFEGKRPELKDYFTKTASTQISVSWRDEDHMWSVMNAYVLMLPFLVQSFSNLDEDTVTNTSLQHRISPHGIEGAVPDSFWSSQTGSDYTLAHNDVIWDTELFAAFDAEGALRKLEEPTRLRDLPKDEQTIANYMMASSIDWRLVSLSPVPVSNEPFRLKRRIEFRALDSLNVEDTLAVTAFFNAIAQSDELRSNVLEIANDAGFDFKDREACKDKWQNTLAAVSQDGALAKGLSVAFGEMAMSEVAERLIDLTQDSDDKYLRRFAKTLDKKLAAKKSLSS